MPIHSHALITALSTATLFAQNGPKLPHQIGKPEPKAAACPFEAPHLSDADWAAVAWAAARMERPADIELAIRDLREALARARKAAAKDPRARAALPHVLHALVSLGARLPVDELALPRGDDLDDLRLCLLMRSPDGASELFFEWKQTTPGTLRWEAAGGALALRGHATFATELFGSLRPVLRVLVTKHRSTWQKRTRTEPGLSPGASPAGYPAQPRCTWHVYDRDVVGVRFDDTGRDEDRPDPVDADAEAARLRWLAYLAGEPQPLTFARRFEVRLDSRTLPEAAERYARARRTAEDSLQSVATALIRRKLIPAQWSTRVPPLRAEVVDERSAAERRGAPLPELNAPQRESK